MHNKRAIWLWKISRFERCSLFELDCSLLVIMREIVFLCKIYWSQKHLYCPRSTPVNWFMVFEILCLDNQDKKCLSINEMHCQRFWGSWQCLSPPEMLPFSYITSVKRFSIPRFFSVEIAQIEMGSDQDILEGKKTQNPTTLIIRIQSSSFIFRVLLHQLLFTCIFSSH